MIPNTSSQFQDLFKDCLGFARQMSQIPGVYLKLEVKLGENSFKFEAGNPGSFLAKGKVPAVTGETREGRTLLERRCLLLVTTE